MKYLLSGVALAAALAISASAGAQGSGASASPSTMPPPTSSATPPMKRAARPHHATHAKTMHHGPTSATDTTAQLNRAELARVSSGGPAATDAERPAAPAAAGWQFDGHAGAGCRGTWPDPIQYGHPAAALIRVRLSTRLAIKGAPSLLYRPGSGDRALLAGHPLHVLEQVVQGLVGNIGHLCEGAQKAVGARQLE